MAQQQQAPTSAPASAPAPAPAPAIPEHRRNVSLASSSYLRGWGKAGRPLRTIFQGKGCVMNPDAITHREFKSSKGKKGVKVPPPVPVYPNNKFSPWQAEMARALHDGKNVIADVTTSCGKTWAANLITAYEILSRETPKGSKATGLIISPNSEVMRDSTDDICKNHTKQYHYGGTKMLNTMTRNFSTYDERHAPHSQLMVVAVECIETFITDPINEDFVKNLEIIVFDEVHLGPVTSALWWSKFIPHTAQLVLLSATLGDSKKIVEIVQDIQQAQVNRPRGTCVIKYNVRPIPLQPLVFRGLDERPECGPRSKSLKGAGKLACLINQFDPTRRDMLSLLKNEQNPTPYIPEDREEQYKLGQQVIAENEALVKQKLKDGLVGAKLEPTAENVYDLLCYLFANDKQPALVFNTTAGATEHLCRTLIAHIAQMEREDEEYRAATKQFQTYEKQKHRDRDKKSRSKAMEKGEWSKTQPADDPISVKININDVRKTLMKYRFPSDLTEVPENMPQWIKDALEYGVGVYVSTMKVWQRHFMFDAFKAGAIQILFSDSSISVGINLPIRTAIMCGRMKDTLYKQASGRAGRRGMDDQGFIMHLMPMDDIIKCLTTKTPEVDLHMPKYMNHSDLIRVLVPQNLQSYYHIDPFTAKKNGEVVPEFDNTEAKPIPNYSRQILTNYLNTLDDEARTKCIKQILAIHKEQWHYHCLTNMVKTLPEKNSIILVKLLAMGILHSFSLKDFYNLMGLLFNRVERDEADEAQNPDEFYVPELPNDTMKTVIRASEVYGLDVDFTKPIHRYFYDFCRKQIVYPWSLSRIEAMGEWLYTFRLGVMAVCPKEGRGKKAKPIDKFAEMLIQADTEYLAARTSKSF